MMYNSNYRKKTIEERKALMAEKGRKEFARLKEKTKKQAHVNSVTGEVFEYSDFKRGEAAGEIKQILKQVEQKREKKQYKKLKAEGHDYETIKNIRDDQRAFRKQYPKGVTKF